MLSELLERLFHGSAASSSRNDVKQRLRFILAHDRADLDPGMIERMRQEILEVVSRYVEIETEGLEFSLESDQRMSALIANVPIRRMKPRSPVDQPSSPADSTVEAKTAAIASEDSQSSAPPLAVATDPLSLNFDDIPSTEDPASEVEVSPSPDPT